MKLFDIATEILLTESEKVTVKDKEFIMWVQPNISPTKSGMRIRFGQPDGAEPLSKNEMDDITVYLQKVLNGALSPYGISVNSDSDANQDKSRQLIGFYIAINQLEMFIKDALEEYKRKNTDEKSPASQKEKEQQSAGD
jgi:hypothetical protein